MYAITPTTYRVKLHTKPELNEKIRQKTEENISNYRGKTRETIAKFLLSGIVALFILEHALQGWCPPLPLIRKLGVRTAAEIDEERAALQKMLKDEKHIPINNICA